MNFKVAQTLVIIGELGNSNSCREKNTINLIKEPGNKFPLSKLNWVENGLVLS
ncbi:hypothetical protein CRD_01029 [Raphidiopsis brookii D9]|nr:hypothetical protein CRD_01029 [Raphidiopsis brookii D9]